MGKFSPFERRVLDIIGKRKVKMTAITEEIKGGSSSYTPATVVSTAIKRINKKCKIQGLNWEVQGEGRGPSGRTVWIEKSSK